MMGENRYVDTRGAVAEAIPFTKAVVDGLAPSGGLFVPESIPQLSLTKSAPWLNYRTLSAQQRFMAPLMLT